MISFFSNSASTEATTRPGTINIKVPPGRRHDLVTGLNRTSIDNYLTRNLPNDNDWSEMFGDVRMQTSAEQENIPPITIANPNDRTINENTEENTPMDTVQYQLPSAENIDQHQHICLQESNSKTVRTSTSVCFDHRIDSFIGLISFLGLRLRCLTEHSRLLAKHEAIYREDCQRERLLKRSVPTNVFEISDPRSWTPHGTLLGHIHLHNAKITRYEFLSKTSLFSHFNWNRLTSKLVSPSANYYTQFFATGDSKGAIRLWDINHFQKWIIFRPSYSIRGPSKFELINDKILYLLVCFFLSAAPIRGLTFSSDANLHLASLSEDGQLNIFE